MYAVDAGEVRQRVKPMVECPYCEVRSCFNCRIRWHDALSCEEVLRMGKDVALDVGFINITSKGCPHCGYRITHYHGHACHHIRPGSGCPNCGTHFCYSCLQLGHSGTDCGCRLFCSNDAILEHLERDPYPHDARCSCPICPDCRPRRPCAQCDGNCCVCRGLIRPGPMQPEDIPSWTPQVDEI